MAATRGSRTHLEATRIWSATPTCHPTGSGAKFVPMARHPRAKIVTAALAFVVAGSACGLFTIKEPFERWEVTISYVAQDDGGVLAEPARIEVHGPRGELRVNNSTRVDRGFKIDDLGIAAEIDKTNSVRLSVSGVEDGKRYRFLDHLNRDGPRGEIVVDYIRQD
jgi:hypothetical protein